MQISVYALYVQQNLLISAICNNRNKYFLANNQRTFRSIFWRKQRECPLVMQSFTSLLATQYVVPVHIIENFKL